MCGQKLCALRNPVEAWTSPQAHWLDRIARVKKLLDCRESVEKGGTDDTAVIQEPSNSSMPDG